MDEKIKINIYGDSIMKGTVIDESLRYRATMAENLKIFGELFGVEIKNRSHFGYTIDKGYEVLQKDLEEGLRCDYALIEYGGNDCSFRWGEIAANPERCHEPLTLLECFAETCKKMLTDLKSRAITPILMTLPPLDAERHLNFVGRNGDDRKHILSWLGGDPQMIYRFHELYSGAVRQIAEQTGTLLIDVRSRFLDKLNFKELMGLDGVHPAPAGYKLLFDTCRDFAGALTGKNLLHA